MDKALKIIHISKRNQQEGELEMNTTVVHVGNYVDKDETYAQSVDILSKGGILAFPTETVYGLAADATKEQAVAQIFEAKGRPSDNPLIVHVGRMEQVEALVTDVPETARQLMDAFWPGPLTIVMRMRPNVLANNVTPGLETVGIRMPSHPVALGLLRRLDFPLAAPSANRSGKPSPTEASHVLTDLKGIIPLILDGGSTDVGLESTIIDVTTEEPTILRPGGVTKEQIERVIGPVKADAHLTSDQVPRAPGMKYMHYAPDAPLFVIEPDAALLAEAVQEVHAKGQRVAIVGPEELHTEAADWYFSIGQMDQPEKLAAHLYRALRQCDATEADVILAVAMELEGLGLAFMNRLNKAADGKHYVGE